MQAYASKNLDHSAKYDEESSDHGGAAGGHGRDNSRDQRYRSGSNLGARRQRRSVPDCDEEAELQQLAHQANHRDTNCLTARRKSDNATNGDETGNHEDLIRRSRWLQEQVKVGGGVTAQGASYQNLRNKSPR